MFIEFDQLMEDLENKKRQESPPPATGQPLKLRGTATLYGDNRWEFTPQGVGEPQQKGVKRARQSRLFQTTSKTQPRTVMHLSVPADATDVVAELMQDFRQLTKGIEAAPPPERERGRRLLKEDGLDVYYATADNAVLLRCTLKNDSQRRMQQRILTILQKLTTCLATNETFLAQQRPSAQSASGQ